MTHKNSLFSQNPNFYSSIEDKKQDKTTTENSFSRILLHLIVVVTIFILMYVAFKYVSQHIVVHIEKFTFWNTEKETLYHSPKEKSIEEDLPLKKVKSESIIKNIHIEKSLNEVLTTQIKFNKVNSHKQVENLYLKDDYLDTIKKEVGSF